VKKGSAPDRLEDWLNGLDRGRELELGEGEVGLEAGVAVVGGVDALACGQEGPAPPPSASSGPTPAATPSPSTTQQPGRKSPTSATASPTSPSRTA